MLGRLATWLRILGFDATFGSHLGGQALIRHARDEGRVLLTRQRRLRRAANLPPLLFVRSDVTREQLLQLVDELGLRPFLAPFTRCTRCNVALTAASREEIADLVPPYVVQTQSRFSRCSGCHRVYWAATHEEHIRNELVQLGIVE